MANVNAELSLLTKYQGEVNKLNSHNDKVEFDGVVEFDNSIEKSLDIAIHSYKSELKTDNGDTMVFLNIIVPNGDNLSLESYYIIESFGKAEKYYCSTKELVDNKKDTIIYGMVAEELIEKFQLSEGDPKSVGDYAFLRLQGFLTDEGEYISKVAYAREHNATKAEMPKSKFL